MKRISLIMACVAMLAACSKSKSSAPDVAYPVGMHAKINGVAWEAAYVSKITATGSLGYSFIIDGPDTPHYEHLMISLESFDGKGSCAITAAGPAKAYYSQDSNFMPVPVYAASGQITITLVNDSAVSGTFNFVAGSKTITDGTFYVTFH